MPKQKLMDDLVNRYEDSALMGESAADAGVAYSLKTKNFTLEFGDESYELPAAFVADHPKGGDEFTANIKKWIKG